MPVAVHKNIDQANIASMRLNSEPAVTSLNVSARIDYIQRFSKQAVLVIHDDATVYSHAARQFLINLSKDHNSQATNVAFVSASTKLNDIQMRCRLIEQLFSNTLFDPEKSLAVSILNLSKKNNETITIVIENAHALSLQIKYELCQLVDVANKTQNNINVTFFGLEKAAQIAASNKTIFKNKLAIIDAESGQIFPLAHAKFKQKKAIFSQKNWLKFAMTVVIFGTLTAVSWFMLYHYDNFSLSQLPAFEVQNSNEQNQVLDVTQQKNLQIIKTKSNEIGIEKNTELANSADIKAALLGEIMIKKETKADAKDILQALELHVVNNQSELIVKTNKKIAEATTAKVSITSKSTLPKFKVIPSVNTNISGSQEIAAISAPIPISNSTPDNGIGFSLPITLSSAYYLNASSGYIVQIMGLTKLNPLEKFIKLHPDLEFYAYQKEVAAIRYIVLTTKIFASKSEAQLALNTLPKDIIDSGAWIKDLTSVKAEINKAKL